MPRPDDPAVALAKAIERAQRVYDPQALAQTLAHTADQLRQAAAERAMGRQDGDR